MGFQESLLSTYLRGMKMMPLMIFSCSRTLAMLGAVNWKTKRRRHHNNNNNMIRPCLISLTNTCLATPFRSADWHNP